MLARLQRTLVLSVVALAAAWWWWSGRHDVAPAWRILAGMVILLPHACVLAVEFLLLGAFGDSRPAVAPTVWQLFRAWFGEVLWGVATFGWRQPFRSTAVPDHLPVASTGRCGVLLVHGFVCNRGLWNPWMRRLRAAGVPYIAVTLEPVFGSIEDYEPIIDAAVQRVEAATGRPPLIVAHSMGGLAVRYWLHHRTGAQARCAGVVTVGTPHAGTWLARFAFSRNGREMRRGGPWLATLNNGWRAEQAALFTCYYGHCDNIVFPAATAMLHGADNRHLAGLAHVHLLSSELLFTEVMQRLVSPAQPGSAPAITPPGPASVPR